MTTLVAATAALLLALAGCSSPSTTEGGGTGADDSAVAETSAGTDGDADADAGGSDADAAGGGVCDLIPAAELAAALGTDPGAGVAGEGPQQLTSCTWTIDGTSALAQLGDAATYFPVDLYPKPDGASDLTGVTTGWASAELRTVFVVKNGQGLMLNDFLLGTAPGDQDAWTALGNAVAENL